jgi:hypothetical protein
LVEQQGIEKSGFWGPRQPEEMFFDANKKSIGKPEKNEKTNRFVGYPDSMVEQEPPVI